MTRRCQLSFVGWFRPSTFYAVVSVSGCLLVNVFNDNGAWFSYITEKEYQRISMNNRTLAVVSTKTRLWTCARALTYLQWRLLCAGGGTRWPVAPWTPRPVACNGIRSSLPHWHSVTLQFTCWGGLLVLQHENVQMGSYVLLNLLRMPGVQVYASLICIVELLFFYEKRRVSLLILKRVIIYFSEQCLIFQKCL